MANVAKKAILRAKVEGILTDLMVKTTSEQVYVDSTTTLASKLADIMTAVDGKAAATHSHAQSEVTGLEDALTARPTTEAMNTAISTAISDLIDGAPETYDTLKEIADYISQHAEVVDALNAAIGNKADKTTVEAMQQTIDALGALANKDTVAEADLDTALAEKINAATAAQHTHANAEVLEGISAEDVANWDAKGQGTVYYSATEPANLGANDLWVQIIE